MLELFSRQPGVLQVADRSHLAPLPAKEDTSSLSAILLKSDYYALTSLYRAQVWTLRERLLKLDARVVSTVRRVVAHLPESFPWQNDFQKMATAPGATAG
jgi:hypothetical protein